MSEIIMAIDQGTTGTTVLLLDPALNVLAKGYQEFRQIYPKPGWVEHNLNDIWASVESSVTQALKHANVKPGQIKAIGITNQRETTCAWNRNTGEPYNHAIVWQCRRTADECKRMREAQLESLYTKRTGLLLDPYLAGTKFKWLLDNVDGLRADAESGKAAFGTIDSFLVYRLTGGVHVTDVSNASRTLLFNLETMNWDDELLEPLTVPRAILAEIVDSSAVYGETKGLSFLPDGIPVAGMAGDQQAALFGQACFEPGTAKCTYGTGSFVLLNIGDHVIHSRHRLLTTVGWRIGDETVYALEGSCFIAGAAVQWMRDGLSAFKESPMIEALAESVPDNGGVVFVPALTGLGAPHWNPDAKGVVWGITRGTTMAHIARATLEAIALQNHEIIQAMQSDYRKPVQMLKVDGGAAANNLMVQFQADILGAEISRPTMLETTALGAAFLAGLAVGTWKDKDELRKVWKEDRRFAPNMPKEKVDEHLRLWDEGVKRV